MQTPSKIELVTQLLRERNFLARHKIPCTDVRLCVSESGAWWINHGDVCYDTEHSDYCGASSIAATDSLDEIAATAEDLIAQVDDQIGESQS